MLSYIAVFADQGVAHGHNTLADWLFLFAFIVAIVAAILLWLAKSIPTALIAVAIGLVAIAWFVL